MDKWLIGVLPLAGVMLGAFLQHYFARVAEREKHASTLRSQAYADFLRAIAGMISWPHFLALPDQAQQLRAFRWATECPKRLRGPFPQ